MSLGTVLSCWSDAQFVDNEQLPGKVLMDASSLSLTAFSTLTQPLQQQKLKQPANDTYLNANEHVPKKFVSVVQS